MPLAVRGRPGETSEGAPVRRRRCSPEPLRGGARAMRTVAYAQLRQLRWPFPFPALFRLVRLHESKVRGRRVLCWFPLQLI